METENVLITLGEQGMMLFQKKGAPHYIPTKAREVFDVSGAGDTAIALLHSVSPAELPRPKRQKSPTTRVR